MTDIDALIAEDARVLKLIDAAEELIERLRPHAQTSDDAAIYAINQIEVLLIEAGAIIGRKARAA